MKSRISLNRYYNGKLTAVAVGNLMLWFSYETIVAFQEFPEPAVISENHWTNTTGKHLNFIDNDKKKRVGRDVFEAKLDEALDRYGLNNYHAGRAVDGPQQRG